MFFKKQTSIDTIIVGLGNPGKKYEGTRHNAGFAALDHVAEKWGSAGGHNGIKSIIGNIGQDFPRVKIGVGEKPRPEYDLADWVLSRLTQAEKKAVEARYDDICGALELMMKGQFDTAMSRYNG